MPKYKHGKQKTPITLEDFREVMEKGTFMNKTHKSFLAFLFWFGLRISEVLERKKEDFQLKDGILYVDVKDRKKGGMETQPLEIFADLPFVDLIIERWKRTRRKKRLWNFCDRTGRRIVKRAMGDKYYPHFFRLNRATSFLDDPKTTTPEMMTWFGWKAAKTIDAYIGHSKRHIAKQRDRLRQQLTAEA